MPVALYTAGSQLAISLSCFSQLVLVACLVDSLLFYHWVHVRIRDTEMLSSLHSGACCVRRSSATESLWQREMMIGGAVSGWMTYRTSG